MSGGNVTIAQFTAATTAPIAGDSFAAYQATASTTVRFLATQVFAYVYATTPVMTGQSTATIATAGSVNLASGPVGYLVVSINGTSRKIPYYAT